MKRNVLILLMLTLVLCFSGVACQRKGVQPIDRTNTAIPAFGKFTKNQVRDAIIRGGSNIGWQMREEKPGLILGTWATRENSVTVQIPYTEKEYVIKYHSSVNMLDNNDGLVHGNYNRWTERLNRHITQEISKMSKK